MPGRRPWPCAPRYTPPWGLGPRGIPEPGPGGPPAGEGSRRAVRREEESHPGRRRGPHPGTQRPCSAGARGPLRNLPPGRWFRLLDRFSFSSCFLGGSLRTVSGQSTLSSSTRFSRPSRVTGPWRTGTRAPGSGSPFAPSAPLSLGAAPREAGRLRGGPERQPSCSPSQS